MASAYDAKINGIYYDLIPKGKAAEVTSGDDKYTGNVTIPESFTYDGVTYNVTSIVESAFGWCSGLTSVVIPNSVKSIGKEAFRNCANLESVTIPNSVTSIGFQCFTDCTSLSSVTIPNSVRLIEGGAFAGCSGLTSIIVERGNTIFDSRNNCNAIVETATNTLFRGCKSTIIPTSVTSIGSGAFSSCTSLTSIIIPTSVTSIGSGAFSYCTSLTSIQIPTSVTLIGNGAFDGCSGLTEVTIPNSVTSLEWMTFCNCSNLSSVTIGDGMKTIGNLVFASCPKLADFYCYTEMVPETMADVFNNSYSNYATLHVPEGSIEDYKAAIPWSGFGNIQALSGENPEVPITKCATPTIIFENRKLSFNCETEGVKYVYNFSTPSESDEDGKDINMPNKLQLSVYAQKDGLENSDVATKEIDLGTSGIRGDVNNDGVVSMPDAMFIVNRILNGKFPDEEDNGSKPGVRFGFYETIPGYSVKIDKVNMDGVSPYVMGSNAVGTILSRTSSQPTWDNSNGSYSFVDIANSNDMFVRIDYTLTADDGGGETIAVKDAIVAIPSQYIQWLPNYKYTYVIKVHNSNSYIGEGTPLFDKYPASFDAIVIEDDNGNSTVTTITTR